MPDPQAQSVSLWSRSAMGCLRIPSGSRIGSTPFMPVWPQTPKPWQVCLLWFPSQTGAYLTTLAPPTRRQATAGIFLESAWSASSSVGVRSAAVVTGSSPPAST
jgi:hypothetical protein